MNRLTRISVFTGDCSSVLVTLHILKVMKLLSLFACQMRDGHVNRNKFRRGGGLFKIHFSPIERVQRRL